MKLTERRRVRPVVMERLMLEQSVKQRSAATMQVETVHSTPGRN
jgi:hypothetical protein